MDQTLVTSGFDIEIALGERYLQYVLLLALDAGHIPIKFMVDDPAPINPAGPITAILTAPGDIDRTYPPHPETDTTPAPPAYGELPSPQGFQVEVLFNDPHSADLKVTVCPWFTRTGPAMDVRPVYELFVKLGLQKEPEPDGHGLATAGLSLELITARLFNTTTEDAAVLAKLKPYVDQTLDLGGLGAGGRIDDIAMRKVAPTSSAPAALNIYLNLMLRSGPAADHFLPARGDVLMGQNILPAGEDLVFATRKDLYDALATDAWFKRAKPSGSGYTYPLDMGDSHGTLDHIRMRPTTVAEGPNRLRIDIKAEVELNNLPNPDMTVIVDVYGSVDSEGVMAWDSSSTAYQSGLFYDALEIMLAGVALAVMPIVGPLGLASILHIAEGSIADAFIGDKAEKRLDATLLDIAPTRLTMFRRRWDPFYQTQHQIGLRPGGTLITEDGIAFWGRAVLTGARKPVYDVVIRDTEHVEDEAPTALRYRVHDADAYPELLDKKLTAQGADRLDFIKYEDPNGEPYLFQLTVGQAIGRIVEKRLIGAIPYTVERIEAPGGTANKLLVISRREYDEERGRLINERTNVVTLQMWADHEAEVRTQVLDAFAALGLFPTSEELEAAVAAGIQPFIEAEMDAYLLGPLPPALDAALLPLLRLELAQTHFGKLQQDGILIIKYYDLVHVPALPGYYYRDRFVAAIENTPAKRMADNLHSKPRYRSTPDGPVFS